MYTYIYIYIFIASQVIWPSLVEKAYAKSCTARRPVQYSKVNYSIASYSVV